MISWFAGQSGFVARGLWPRVCRWTQCWFTIWLSLVYSLKDNRTFLIKRMSLCTVRWKWLTRSELPSATPPFNSEPLWCEPTVSQRSFHASCVFKPLVVAQRSVFIESIRRIDRYLNELFEKLVDWYDFLDCVRFYEPSPVFSLFVSWIHLRCL